MAAEPLRLSSELVTDPRTGIPLIREIPAEFASLGVEDAMLHWLGHVVVYDRRWQPRRKVGLLSDLCWWCLDRQSNITHCLRVGCLEELICTMARDGCAALGLRSYRPESSGGPTSHDLLLGFQGVGDRDAVVSLLTQIHSALTEDDPSLPTLQVTHSVEDPAPRLRLEWPADSLSMEPIQSRTRVLADMRGQQRRAVAAPQAAPRPAAASRTPAEVGLAPPPAPPPRELRGRRAAAGSRREHGAVFDSAPDGVFDHRPARPAHAHRPPPAWQQGRGGDGGGGGGDALRHAEEELERCKTALRSAIRGHAEEMDTVRQEFLAYDAEVAAYLHRVFTAFPAARDALGPPPRPDAAHAHPQQHPDLQRMLMDLSSENAALHRHIDDLQGMERPHLGGSVPPDLPGAPPAPPPGPRPSPAEFPRPEASAGGPTPCGAYGAGGPPPAAYGGEWGLHPGSPPRAYGDTFTYTYGPRGGLGGAPAAEARRPRPAAAHAAPRPAAHPPAHAVAQGAAPFGAGRWAQAGGPGV